MNLMLPPKASERSATLAQTLWLMTACSLMFAWTAYGVEPAWWTSRGAVNPALGTNDYSVVTQGQLKRFTQKAVDELNSNLPGGAGSDLNAMVSNWTAEYTTNGYNATNHPPADLKAMTVGQVKYVASKIWAQLAAYNFTNDAPTWLVTNAGDSSLAVIGQVKTAFDFDLSTNTTIGDSDSNGLADWWEMYYFGHLGNNPSALAPSGDGYTILQEYQMGNNPINYYHSITPTVTIISGNNQSVATNAFASSGLEVRVQNASGGAAISSAPVTFSIASGSSGGVSGTSGGTTGTSATVLTDASGYATVYYKSGTEGYKINTITATATATSVAANFTAFCGVQNGLALWLKADAGVTTGTSGNVTAWADQSSNGNNGTGPSGRQPLFISSSSPLNGKPVIRFDGTSQYVDIAESSTLRPTSGLTLIAVARPNVIANYGRIITRDYNTGSTWSSPYVSYSIYKDITGPVAFQTGHSGGTPLVQTFAKQPLSTNLPCLLTGIFNGSTDKFYSAGALQDTATDTASLVYNTPIDTAIGGCSSGRLADFFSGDIAEVMIYNRGLNSTEQNEAEVYLANKYGLYHPNATWPSSPANAYSSDVQAEITRNQWNKAQADAYVAYLATNPGVPATGLVTWLKADNGVTTVSGGVSQWADQGPLGNNAQGISGSRPTVTSTAINGHAAINFNGSSQYLSIPDSPSFRPPTETVFAVAIRNGGTDYSQIISKPYYNSTTWNAPYQAYGLFYDPNGQPYGVSAINIAENYIATSTQAVNLGQPYLLSTTYDGTSLIGGQDGIPYSYYNSTATPGSIDYGNNTEKDLVIGRSSTTGTTTFQYLNGEVAEVLIYNRAITYTEQLQVEVYLADKYGLYHPNATWPSSNGYSNAVLTEITRNKWNKKQADDYATFLAGNPAVPPAGLVLWLSADTITTGTGGGAITNNGPINKWPDQGPAHNDAVQLTSTYQPTWLSSGINSKPAVSFSSSSPKFLAVPDNSFLRPSTVTILAVASPTPGSDYGRVLCKPYAASGWTSPWVSYELSYDNASLTHRPYVSCSIAGTDYPSYGPSVTSGNNYMFAGGCNGSAINFYQFSSTLSAATTSTNSVAGVIDYGDLTRKDLIVGGSSTGYLSQAFDGKIAEILLYNRALTASELQQATLYLTRKYGLVQNLTPTISPNGGSYTSSQAVTISASVSGGTVHYTIDGTTPTASSPTFSSLTLSQSALVQAVTVVSGAVVDRVASAQFYVNDSSHTGLATAPSSVTATANGAGGEIDLSWTLSGQTTYGSVNVYRKTGSGAYELIATLAPGTTSYADTNVDGGSSYQYEIGTANQSGTALSSATSSLSPTTISPVGITVTAPSGATSVP